MQSNEHEEIGDYCNYIFCDRHQKALFGNNDKDAIIWKVIRAKRKRFNEIMQQSATYFLKKKIYCNVFCIGSRYKGCQGSVEILHGSRK